MAHEHYNKEDNTYTIPDGGNVIEHASNALEIAKGTHSGIFLDTSKSDMMLLIKPEHDLKTVIRNYEKKQHLEPSSIAQGIPQVISPPAQEKGR